VNIYTSHTPGVNERAFLVAKLALFERHDAGSCFLFNRQLSCRSIRGNLYHLRS
jgi:hypothetical protein